MYQVPPQVWNQIAQEQRLQTRLGKRLFPTAPDKMLSVLNEAEGELIRRGADPSVAAAFLTIFPLLCERKALSAFGVNHPQYLDSLTPYEGINEALIAASRDRPMSRSEQRQLRLMLTEVTHY